MVVVGIPAVEIGLCIIRVYFNGFGIVRDGLRKVALFVVGKPPVVISLCIVRIYCNDPGIV